MEEWKFLPWAWESKKVLKVDGTPNLVTTFSCQFFVLLANCHLQILNEHRFTCWICPRNWPEQECPQLESQAPTWWAEVPNFFFGDLGKSNYSTTSTPNLSYQIIIAHLPSPKVGKLHILRREAER
jgi:hypothetical protein